MRPRGRELPRQIDRHRALAVVHDLMTARMKQFEHIIATEIPFVADVLELDEEERATLDGWVVGLQDWLSGILDWHNITRRYDEKELRELNTLGTVLAGGTPKAFSSLPPTMSGLGWLAARPASTPDATSSPEPAVAPAIPSVPAPLEASSAPSVVAAQAPPPAISPAPAIPTGPTGLGCEVARIAGRLAEAPPAPPAGLMTAFSLMPMKRTDEARLECSSGQPGLVQPEATPWASSPVRMARIEGRAAVADRDLLGRQQPRHPAPRVHRFALQLLAFRVDPRLLHSRPNAAM